MSARIARHLGASQVFGVDLVGERLEMARRHGVEAINLEDHDDLAGELRERTGELRERTDELRERTDELRERTGGRAPTR